MHTALPFHHASQVVAFFATTHAHHLNHKLYQCLQCTCIACRFLMPSLQPYGGRGWTTACLLPPSCISLYANVLLKLESAQRGISRETLHLSVNSQSPFSAATVFQMLLLDIVLYAVLTWYLDQVRIYCICPIRLYIVLHLLNTSTYCVDVCLLHLPIALRCTSHLYSLLWCSTFAKSPSL